MSPESDQFVHIEAGELFLGPSLARRWYDTVKKMGGIAVYLVDDRLPKIQIKAEPPGSERVIREVEVSNYDTLRFTLRDTRAFQEFIALRTADIGSVEFATD